jgi:hypothetical protein
MQSPPGTLADNIADFSNGLLPWIKSHFWSHRSNLTNLDSMFESALRYEAMNEEVFLNALNTVSTHPKGSKQNLICGYCNKNRHAEEKCWKKIRETKTLKTKSFKSASDISAESASRELKPMLSLLGKLMLAWM